GGELIEGGVERSVVVGRGEGDERQRSGNCASGGEAGLKGGGFVGGAGAGGGGQQVGGLLDGASGDDALAIQRRCGGVSHAGGSLLRGCFARRRRSEDAPSARPAGEVDRGGQLRAALRIACRRRSRHKLPGRVRRVRRAPRRLRGLGIHLRAA